MHIFGAHLSIAGGYVKALERATAIGGNCLQMFSGNPRSFGGPPVLSEAAARCLRARAAALRISPIYFHAPYLVNLASEEPTGDLSEKLLIAELSTAARLGVRGSIVHLGSFKKASGAEKERQYGLLVERIRSILAATPKETALIIENAGTRKIGRTLDEIAEIIADVGDVPAHVRLGRPRAANPPAADSRGHADTLPRVMVCLDTCHLHAAGYDLRGKEKLDEFLKEFDKKIGLERLACFHLNDSRDPFGSLRDRHDNIGEGEVGREVFRVLLIHPDTKNLSFIIETPGFDGEGPDKENLEILKGMVGN